MFDVQILVAGDVDPTWLAGGIPGFTTGDKPPVTIIRGVLGPGQDMSAIVGILGRHGLTPLDLWMGSSASDA
jgi:hypothetical protein